MHAHMPAIEIPFGETRRAASQAVAAWAHFRFRVAMGRRSIVHAITHAEHDNREHAIAERFDSASPSSPLGKCFSKFIIHAPPRESDVACGAQTARAAPIRCR